MSEEESRDRLSVPVKIVPSVVQEHGEATCSGHNHGQNNDFPRRNWSTRYPPGR